MGLFDFFSGPKKQEQPTATVPRDVLFPKNEKGEVLNFLPKTPPVMAKNLLPQSVPKYGGTGATLKAATPGAKVLWQGPPTDNEIAAPFMKSKYQESKEYLKPLIRQETYDEGGIDDIAEELISNGRKISKRDYLSASEASRMPKYVGETLYTMDKVAQAGEGVISGALDLPGRLGESLGFKSNLLQTTTGQQKLSIMRKWLEENAPDRLPEFEAAVEQEGYSQGAEVTGRTLETVAESVAVGSAVVRVTSALPAMQKLANSGRWGRFAYTAINNIAADVGVRTEQAYKNKNTVEEIARGVASSPSQLFAFYSIPAIGIGMLADGIAGHMNGMEFGDNMANIGMNVATNFLDYRGIKEYKRLADVPVDKAKEAFMATFRGPKELAEQTWKEMSMVYHYAQANPGDIRGTQRVYVDGEKRILKLKRDFIHRNIEAERRLAKYTGPDETPGVPKKPTRMEELLAKYGSEDNIPLHEIDNVEFNRVQTEAEAGKTPQELLTPVRPASEATDPIASTPAAKSTMPTASDPQTQGGRLQEANRQFLEGDQPKSSTLPDDSASPRTPYSKRITTADDFDSPKDVLTRLGMKQRYTELRTAKNESRLELEDLQGQIRGWAKAAPGEASNQRIAQFLDGQIEAQGLQPNELAVAEQIRPVLDEYGKALGLRPGKGFLSDYFPHIFDSKSMRAELPEEIALRIAEAEDPAKSIYNPFVQKRQGVEGYKLDTWTALEAYFRRAVRSKHMNPVLANISADTGKFTDATQVKYIKDFIDRVNFRPTDADVKADNQLKRIFGDTLGPRPVHRLTKQLRRAISRGAFWFNPSTALRNLTQGVNTYASLGERYTVEGYTMLAKKWATGDFAELHKEGILEAGVVQDLQTSALGRGMEKADEAGFKFMRWTEFINRAPAYYGAKAKAMAGKVDGIKAGDERAAIEYAKDLVEDTQFRFDELGTPVGMSSDLMKTATQFQPFTVKQLGFLGRKIKNRDIKGLARYTAGSWVILATVGNSIGLDWKSFIPGARILEDGKYMPPIAQLPWALIAATAGFKDKYGNEPEGGVLKRIVKSKDVQKSLRLFIPGGVQAGKMYEAEKMRQQGGVRSKSGKTELYDQPEDGDLMDWIIAYTLGTGLTKKGKDYYKPERGSDLIESLTAPRGEPEAEQESGLPPLPGLGAMPAMPDLPPLPPL